MTESKEYLQRLIESSSFQDPVLRSVMDALELPAGSRGLDVGCGFGAQVIRLAQEVGEEGHVTGIDISREFLDHGRTMVTERGLSNRISLIEGDMNYLPFDDDSFDWAWSASCVGYFPGDPIPALREIVRVVRPGGTVAIIIWSSENLLPGYPALEARLRQTTSGLAPFSQGMPPEHHHMTLLGRFRELELEDVHARTFVGDAQPPMSEVERKAMAELIGMRWPDVESELSTEDWKKLQWLTNPDSPGYILDSPDYYGFFTYTMFRGTIPDNANI